MATTTFLSLAEYMETSYRPDREYIDGELRERNVGKFDHARIQWLLGKWISRFEEDWGVIGSTEQRMLVAPNRVRIPDLVVMTEQYPPEVLVDPPLLVIEVLSPDDSYAKTQAESTDYFEMGVPSVWIVDPRTRTARQGAGQGWSEVALLSVPGSPVQVDIAAIFKQLDANKRPPRN